MLAALVLAGCAAQDIDEIKNEEHVGEKVTVRGSVESPLKIGGISGFTLVDDSGESIRVSSESLPAENDTITVKGTLMKDTLLGYYIKRDE